MSLLEIDEARARRVRRKAGDAFERAHARHAPVAKAWSRLVVPALLAATCAVYLSYAAHGVAALYH